ncbi:MAG: hypothetical protein LUD17_01870 [Bacteroidales bacterium]|nr:hypothetical protein [Bacteroidales bacterium]
MKKTFTLLLVALVGLISAQAAGLDYGQWSQEPWTAKYFYGTDSNGLAPDENWFAKDFDDSEWDDIQGPISNSSTSYYYVTEWEVSWSTYWLRRHFSVDETAKSYLLLITHDDGVVVYINGQEVYNYGYAGLLILGLQLIQKPVILQRVIMLLLSKYMEGVLLILLILAYTQVKMQLV